MRQQHETDVVLWLGDVTNVVQHIADPECIFFLAIRHIVLVCQPCNGLKHHRNRFSCFQYARNTTT